MFLTLAKFHDTLSASAVEIYKVLNSDVLPPREVSTADTVGFVIAGFFYAQSAALVSPNQIAKTSAGWPAGKLAPKNVQRDLGPRFINRTTYASQVTRFRHTPKVGEQSGQPPITGVLIKPEHFTIRLNTTGWFYRLFASNRNGEGCRVHGA